jgi:hypothetical protein
MPLKKDQRGRERWRKQHQRIFIRSQEEALDDLETQKVHLLSFPADGEMER